ncbi:hypothetical protein CRG98_012881 [Punica granatum]|uniref:Uncharacterized protein n=1 Tax=Punica granatum TaxID=22663 RepID=A0A2I0KFV0_PUNGR|nr:hypothetical protein CRG98_012881 [Punica granatum]
MPNFKPIPAFDIHTNNDVKCCSGYADHSKSPRKSNPHIDASSLPALSDSINNKSLHTETATIEVAPSQLPQDLSPRIDPGWKKINSDAALWFDDCDCQGAKRASLQYP